MTEKELIYAFPSRVELDKDGHIITLHLNELELEAIPILKLPKLKKLDLSRNNIKILENISYPLDSLNLTLNPLKHMSDSFEPLKIQHFEKFTLLKKIIVQKYFSVEKRSYLDFLFHQQWLINPCYSLPQPKKVPEYHNPTTEETYFSTKKTPDLTQKEKDQIFDRNLRRGIPRLNCDRCSKMNYLYTEQVNVPFIIIDKLAYYNSLNKILYFDLCYHCCAKYKDSVYNNKDKTGWI